MILLVEWSAAIAGTCFRLPELSANERHQRRLYIGGRHDHLHGLRLY
jgi:hypothetical protein